MPNLAAAPLLTVLMTTYNALPYLEEAVESILKQTAQQIVFLIVDNGSTDGTQEYLREVKMRLNKAKNGPNTVPFNPRHNPGPHLQVESFQENTGVTAALSFGLSQVTTEFTALMAADDVAMPTRLQRQLTYFQQHPFTDLLGSAIVYIDGSGSRLGDARFPTRHEALQERFSVENQFPRSACMFRTKSARKSGGFSSAFHLAPAAALWASMLRLGYRVASIDEPLTLVRLRPSRTRRDLALLMLRAKESYRLTTIMRSIPRQTLAARQAALIVGGRALIRLDRRMSGLGLIVKACYMAPWLIPFNPLLWRRFIARLRGQRTGYFL